jgi:hypothetical protein
MIAKATKRSKRVVLGFSLLTAVFVAAACAGASPTTSLTSSATTTSSSAAAVATRAPATPAPTTTPTPSKTAAPNLIRTGCDRSPCELSAGTWTLSGRYSFIEGAEITVPDGWESREQDAGEFNLFPLAHPDDHIFMVKDIAPVTVDGSAGDGSAGIVSTVPRTIDGLTAYWRSDPNLDVSKSQPATIAGGIPAITYVISVSPHARFTDPECPVAPLCAALFTDPRYWEGSYAFGAPAAVRVYLATIRNGTEDHLFMIGLEGADAAALKRLTKDAAPIIASLRIPASFPVW